MSRGVRPPDGVRPLDHTADVGLELGAPDFCGLLERAALGMDWLLREGSPPSRPHEARDVVVDGGDPALDMRALLRELLRWHERDGFAPARVEIVGGEAPPAVRIRVHGGLGEAHPVREIKGVTLHGLAAEPRDGGWWGCVVFDV